MKIVFHSTCDHWFGISTHQFIAYLSDYYHIFWLSEMAILSKVHEPDNFWSHNFLGLSFNDIQSWPNFAGYIFFLESSLLISLLYVRQTQQIQLIQEISLWRAIFISLKRVLLLICMVLQFMWRRNYIDFIPRKL